MTVDVRYIVEDVEAAAAFYLSHLGFEEAERRGGAPFRMLARGDLRLWLSGPGSSAARPMPDGAQPAPGGWNRFVIEVGDIEAEVARLREAGVPFRSAIVSGPGGKQAVLDDPSGNPVELFQPA
ncbi:MAG: VOC family protein [Chloroflexota bacterium]|nr:VOC family protein [Chloroflexota bacterium]